MTEVLQNKNLPLLLLQMREQVLSHFRPILNHFNLTEQQWRVLRALCQEGKLEPREICDICQILSPSMAGILKRLEEMELIQRESVPGDKRRMQISLTKKSEALILEIIPLVKEQYRYLNESYGEKLMQDLHSITDRFFEKRDVKVKLVKIP